MPRGLNNWNFNQVVKFLKKNDFSHVKTKGSHFFYFKKAKTEQFLVVVPFHGNKSIDPKTMKSIISQSGISKEEWFKK